MDNKFILSGIIKIGCNGVKRGLIREYIKIYDNYISKFVLYNNDINITGFYNTRIINDKRFGFRINKQKEGSDE